MASAGLLREHGVAWVEEPVGGDRVADLERLHERTGMAVATGENVYGLNAFRALAVRHGTVVNPHFYGGAVGYAATLQLAAHAAVVGTVEYDVRDNPLLDPLLRDPPTRRNGVVALPSWPGLGVDLDPDAVDERTRSVMTVA